MSQPEIANFVRNDGMEFDCEVGSASFKVFEKDDGFTRVYPDEKPADAEPKAPAKKPQRPKK